MPDRSVKDLMLAAVDRLPPDATVEEAMERLYFLSKIERGLAQADSDDTVSHDEVRRRLNL